jgi:ERF superfamily
MTEVVSFPTSAPAPATLVGAIAAVMGEVHTVAKHGVNEFHRYRYAKMEDILKEITPLLGKHGLVIFQNETGRAMFDEDNVIAVEYSFTVAHVSGETWPQPLRQTGVSTCRNSKGGWDDKSLNKCHTAARKYFLLALFQIPTGEEDDADQGDNDDARRAAVQLKRALPQYVVEPPKRKLERELDKQRHVGAGYEALIRSENRQERKFRQPLQPAPNGVRYDERHPPPDDTIPDSRSAEQPMRTGCRRPLS